MVVQPWNDGTALGVETQFVVDGLRGGDFHDPTVAAPDVQRCDAVDFGVGDQQPFVP